MKKAFTLAEVMIVLVIIGALTAILLPSAFNSTPKENIMKFKKINTNIMNIVRDLVSSDKYYLGGDLGKLPSGELVTTLASSDAKQYFCETLTELLTVKVKSCQTSGYTAKTYASKTGTLEELKAEIDSICTASQAVITGGFEFKTADNVEWYQASPQVTFADVNGEGKRYFSSPHDVPAYQDDGGFDANYKVLCIDVDGKDGEVAPFGYGIRADGKVIAGARADSWMEKDIQDKEDD